MDDSISRARWSTRWPLVLLALLALLTLTLTIGTAAAAPGDPGLDPDIESAKRHVQSAMERYEAGDYEAALKEFQVAVVIKPLPQIHYNIARCYERLERYKEAIASYQAFLDGTPAAEDRGEVTARIATLQQRVAALDAAADSEKAATVVVTPIATPRPPDSKVKPYLGPIILGAAAVVVVGVGAGLTVSAHGDYSSFLSSCSPACAPSVWQGSRTHEQAGIALMGVAGALAVADVVWLVVKRPWRHVEASAWLQPSGGGLALGGVLP